MMLGELLDRLFDLGAEVALAEQIVGLVLGVLPLERTVIGVPVLLERLEEHERIPRTVPKLVLRKVARDRVDPGRELLALVESLQVPVHADERLLHEILTPLTISDGPVDEVDEPLVVTANQLTKSPGIAIERRLHDFRIAQLTEPQSVFPGLPGAHLMLLRFLHSSPGHAAPPRRADPPIWQIRSHSRHRLLAGVVPTPEYRPFTGVSRSAVLSM